MDIYFTNDIIWVFLLYKLDAALLNNLHSDGLTIHVRILLEIKLHIVHRIHQRLSFN